jgi:hypothetical protein
MNLGTDLTLVKRITSCNENTLEIVNELIRIDSIAYNEDFLVSKFNKSLLFDKNYYPYSFHYLGILIKIQENDTRQLSGYAEGLRHEYPEAKIWQFVI